ncbi:helicase-related protein [Vibrio splendidus]|uniref:RNA helicase n=1 Tax=Vibrio splendidus TaxID=29497 RepID=A0A2N7JRL4_VIBSP|nr:helicase-related protein [Vibrio splendidus]PMM56030.1 RNA helicase [Vibrio splendidus]
MLKLEDIKKGSEINGIEPDEIVKIVSVDSLGDAALEIVYKTSQGRLGERMLFRSDEAKLNLATVGRAWSFDAAGQEFKLGLEAFRISLAHLFDPMMAVHTSSVEPLPHQISAVYEFMLQKQPLRYVLADDPGAGKTIMAGLLIRELLMRADAKRIMVVSPGSLTEQWQDELLEKFGVQFEIFSKEKQEQCPSGNYFDEQDLLIVRLDQLSRNEDYQEKLKNTEFDLIIVDEAHKMSASYFGSKINETKRFKLGKLLGSICRHYLLMTATPHNGKEEDFQLFMSLLDGDRFYGKFREGAHKVDVSDMMRRMIKEELLKFDGTPLFPERRAYTANYSLSPLESELYTDVTDYVREEMNRADKVGGKRKGTVGFALTQLQRRLASSPEAIYQSIKRRGKRLESRLNEEKLLHRGHQIAETYGKYKTHIPENIDDLEEELTAEEYELYAEQLVDQATAAETIPELEAEIEILKGLEDKAKRVVNSGSDKKWEELSSLLQDRPEMKTASGNRRKLIIFTEHKDTLNYLQARIIDLLGNSRAVNTISGSTNRDERRKIQEEFRSNPELLVLIATDAAGEGVNLQNANLMVNYDLPWNPNRLEQRFGRIHRIGQTEVCHLWNIVASETREGDVFQKLFDKLEIEKQSLGGKVFDILGEAFENVSLKEMLLEAVRYGEDPKVKAKLNEKIEGALDAEHLTGILKRNALTEQHMTMEDLYAVKEEMEKAEARKLQPYFIRAFFTEAFEHLGGQLRQREPNRFEIRHVPSDIRERDRVIGETRTPVMKRYERICFDKENIRVGGKPMAALMHPAHPLMHAATDLVLSAHRSKLKQGAVLVDPTAGGTEPSVLFTIDHSIREGEGDNPLTVSRRLQFVSIDQKGQPSHSGYAPHLDLIPIDDYDRKLVRDIVEAPWLQSGLETTALKYASGEIVPQHYQEVSSRYKNQSEKIMAAVHERLIKEISYWQDRYLKLEMDMQAGKQPRMQPEMAKRRVEELTSRLEQRKRELVSMANVVSSTPVIISGALIIPQGLLGMRKGETQFTADAEARSRVEKVAMDAVFKAEHGLGHITKDVSADKCGWDITSRVPPKTEGSAVTQDRHIEVKGRSKGQTTITVSRNEIMYALNQKEKFWLAIVVVDGDEYDGPHYVRNPFTKEPDFGVASINYELSELLEKATKAEQTI